MRTYSTKMILLAIATTLVTTLILGLLSAMLMSLHLAEVMISPNGIDSGRIGFGLAWGLVAIFMVADLLCIRSLLKLKRDGRRERL